MNYHRAVIKAIEYIQAQPVGIEAEQQVESTSELLSSPDSIYACLRDTADTGTVTLTGIRETEQNVIFARKSTLYEFGSLFHAYADIMGGTIEDEAVRSYYEHEREHLNAYRVLGAKACRMGVSLHLLPKVGGAGLTPSLQPFSTSSKFVTTKLGLATVIGHPEQLSASDINSLNAMGYDDTDDIARRLASQPDGPGHPQPLSLRFRDV